MNMRFLIPNRASPSRGAEALRTFIGLSNAASPNARMCKQYRYNSSGLLTFLDIRAMLMRFG
jgi:hypothetical protein